MQGAVELALDPERTYEFVDGVPVSDWAITFAFVSGCPSLATRRPLIVPVICGELLPFAPGIGVGDAAGFAGFSDCAVATSMLPASIVMQATANENNVMSLFTVDLPALR